MKLEIVLTKERETKRTWRFAAGDDGVEVPSLDTLYVSKPAVRQIGDPEKIKVTIEPV